MVRSSVIGWKHVAPVFSAAVIAAIVPMYGIHPACDALVAAPLNPPRLREADYLESLVPFAVPANVAPGETPTMDLVAGP